MIPLIPKTQLYRNAIAYDSRGANIGNLAHNVQGDQQTNQPEKP
jgi:hypothetical protein